MYYIITRLDPGNNMHLKKYKEKCIRNPIKMYYLNIWKKIKIKISSVIAGRDIKLSYARRSKWDKFWIINLLKDYKESCQLSIGEGKKVPIWSRERFYPVDYKIAPVIFALNRKGVKTNYSCQGKEDGIESEHAITAYISTFPKIRIPEDLLIFLERENVEYRYIVTDSDKLGDGLYSIRGQDAKPFLDAVTKWALLNGVSNINDLKNDWKK